MEKGTSRPRLENIHFSGVCECGVLVSFVSVNQANAVVTESRLADVKPNTAEHTMYASPNNMKIEQSITKWHPLDAPPCPPSLPIVLLSFPPVTKNKQPVKRHSLAISFSTCVMKRRMNPCPPSRSNSYLIPLSPYPLASSSENAGASRTSCAARRGTSRR